MSVCRVRFLGNPAWLVVLAVGSLPFTCAPAFLYFLHKMQVDCQETASPTA